MTSDPDAAVEAAVAALLSANRDLLGSLDGGEWYETDGLVRYGTGLAVSRFNGVVVGAGADRVLATSWLEALADRGLPCCVMSRPDAPGWTAEVAAAAGLTEVSHEPFMVHDDPAAVTVPEVEASIARVDPRDDGARRSFGVTMADGFEAPREMFEPLMTARVLSHPAVSAYGARVGEEVVAVGMATLHDGHVGVFNIATLPAHRRRGLGEAVTARVVVDGVAAGARVAYLQASTMGLPVYRRMGFRTVEVWPTYYPG
jgi:ribosomal protein S18 acetylase RimI-like enzyme